MTLVSISVDAIEAATFASPVMSHDSTKVSRVPTMRHDTPLAMLLMCESDNASTFLWTIQGLRIGMMKEASSILQPCGL